MFVIQNVTIDTVGIQIKNRKEDSNGTKTFFTIDEGKNVVY